MTRFKKEEISNCPDLMEMLGEFHKTFDIERSKVPTVCDIKTRHLRFKLIYEELGKLLDSYHEGNLVEIADALGDLLYVVVGSFVSHGLDMNNIMREIHRSNMTKVGGHKREDGKWIKPKSYDPPKLEQFCQQKRWSPWCKHEFCIDSKVEYCSDCPESKSNRKDNIPIDENDGWGR